MTPLPCRTCRCPDPCDTAERAAETADEWESDPFGWRADEIADRYERTVLGW